MKQSRDLWLGTQKNQQIIKSPLYVQRGVRFLFILIITHLKLCLAEIAQNKREQRKRL